MACLYQAYKGPPRLGFNDDDNGARVCVCVVFASALSRQGINDNAEWHVGPIARMRLGR
jgi:hypothetical protein